MDSQDTYGGLGESFGSGEPAKKRLPWGIIAAIAAVVVVAVVAVVLLVVKPWAGFVTGQREAAKFMPPDTGFYSSVSMDLQNMAGFKHLTDIYGDRSEVQQALQDLEGELKDTFDVTFKEDIKPWLGPEIAFGVTDLGKTLEGETPAVVVAAATRDRKASDAFLGKIMAALEEQGYAVGEETYAKVDYFAAQPEGKYDPPLIFSTVKGYVVITTDKNALQDVIDARSGQGEALAENEYYTNLVKALPAKAVAYTFLDFADLLDTGQEAVQEGLGSSGIELPRETWKQLEAYKGVGLALDLKQDGLQLDLAIAFDPEALPETQAQTDPKASANRILKRVPADSLGFFSAQDLDAVWRGIWASLAELQDVEQQLEDVTDALGVKIDEDLLDWLQGEFALAVVPAGTQQEIPIAGMAVFEVTDEKRAEEVLGDLFDTVERAGGLTAETETVNGVAMQVYPNPFTEQPLLGYALADKRLLIGVLEDGLDRVTDDDLTPISADETFKAVQNRLPEKTTGYFYVNVEQILEVVVQTMGDWDRADFEEVAGPYLKPIKAVGLAVPPADVKKGVTQVTVFVYVP